MAASKAQGRTTLSFNGSQIEDYLRNITCTANGNAIDITSLGDTAAVSLTDNPTWEITGELAFWDATVDAILTPEIITPGTKRALVYGRNDGTSTVSLTWAASGGNGAEIGNLTLPSAVGAAHGGSVTFRLSGAPTRTVA